VSYRNMRHWDWAKRNLDRQGIGYHDTRFFRRSFYMLGVMGRGIYNAPISWPTLEIVQRDNNPEKASECMMVNWATGVASYDGAALTAGVLLAHRFSIRFEIQPRTFQHLRFILSKRQRQGSIFERHADIEQAQELYLSSDEQLHLLMSDDEDAHLLKSDDEDS